MPNIFTRIETICTRNRAKTPPKRARLKCLAQKCLCSSLLMFLQVVLLKNNHMILFIGIVLGSFYYGYAFLQIPGGYLALKLGGTRIFGYAIFLASMLTLLTPVATRYSVYGLIAVRAGEGLMLVCPEYLFLIRDSNSKDWGYVQTTQDEFSCDRSIEVEDYCF